MRVGVNARTFNVNEPDGAVQSARKLTRALGNRDDVELVLYGDAELATQFECAESVNSTGFLSNSPFFGVVWERTVLPLVTNTADLDILLCPNGNSPPIDIPVITYIHDVNAQKKMSSGTHELYRRLLVPLGAKNSDAIVTVSEFSKREIQGHLPNSIPDIHVVYNGIDKVYRREGTGDKLDLPEKYLLYVGAMNPRKNVERLVKAFDSIRETIPHSLVLIGPENKSMYKEMDISSLSDDLLLPGFVTEQELKYAYTNADGFVYPPLYEGFGLPPLEAMACGTPVVSSNRSSLPEILNGYAQLVDPTEVDAIADAILDVATMHTSSERRAELKNHARRFSWERAADELVDVMTNVVPPRLD